MGQVTVVVNGRSYRFDCGEGEEARLQELATYVKDRIDTLTREYGHVGSERLMLMAALLITDELWDARAAMAKDAAGVNKLDAQKQQAGEKAAEDESEAQELPRKRAASGDT